MTWPKITQLVWGKTRSRTQQDAFVTTPQSPTLMFQAVQGYMWSDWREEGPWVVWALMNMVGAEQRRQMLQEDRGWQHFPRSSQTTHHEEATFDLWLENKKDFLHLTSSPPTDLSPSAIILMTFPPEAPWFSCSPQSRAPSSAPWIPVQGHLSFNDQFIYLSIYLSIHLLHLLLLWFHLHRHKCARVFHLKTVPRS